MTRILWQSFVDEQVNRPYLDRLEGYLNASAAPGASVTVVGLTPPARDFGRLSEFRCSITAVANAIRAEEQGFDAFVFGHFQEPGLYEARSACAIPVVGIGEASMLWASQMGGRIGLVSIDPVFTAIHQEQADRYGIGGRLSGVVGLGVTVEGFEAAFAGDDRARQQLDAQFATSARQLIAGGADVILIAGGLYGLLIADQRSPSIDGVPVVSCTPIGLAWAQMAVGIHRTTGQVASDGPAFARASSRARADFLALIDEQP
jgi:allantoin racemase